MKSLLSSAVHAESFAYFAIVRKIFIAESDNEKKVSTSGARTIFPFAYPAMKIPIIIYKEEFFSENKIFENKLCSISQLSINLSI